MSMEPHRRYDIELDLGEGKSRTLAYAGLHGLMEARANRSKKVCNLVVQVQQELAVQRSVVDSHKAHPLFEYAVTLATKIVDA